MAGVKEKTEKYVFGLDIGTRSIVGTVGYLSEGKFHVVAQRVLEHETRAMMDGQIHDIPKVAETITRVRKMLEKDLGRKLRETCVAAAGRVLRTVTQRVEMIFESERDVTREDIDALSMKGVQSSYEELYRKLGRDSRFYCVGHTVMHYYVNDYPITNPEGHRGGYLAADMIATFLPDEVVDGLYKAVELAELKVANLTLEPIAAIHVAIPERYRLLNMALVDVGAGTSDICITKEGTVTAYGMLPIAGDRLTDCIATHFLVDFDSAEHIKRQLAEVDTITFEDIMGLKKKISTEEVLDILDEPLKEMTQEVAAKILELNGDKPVSAVFIVGGGGIIPGYAKRLAEKLNIPKERVAVRGKEVMQNIVFENKNAITDSMMVTPIGICYSFYEPSNNFIFVDINGKQTKLYDNGRLTISDAIMAIKLTNEDLFPRRGRSLTYTVGDRTETVKGKMGEPSYIRLNGSPTDLHNVIRNGDKIDIRVSTKGEDATLYVKQLPEMKEDLIITAGERKISFSKRVEVNGEEKNKEYRIKDGDVIQIYNWYPLERIASVLAIPRGSIIKVNQSEAKPGKKIYDGYELWWEVPLELQEKPEPAISPDEVPETQGGTGFDRLMSKSLKLRSLGQQISDSVTKADDALKAGSTEGNMLQYGNAAGNVLRSGNTRENMFSSGSMDQYGVDGTITTVGADLNPERVFSMDGSEDRSWLKLIPGYQAGSSTSGGMGVIADGVSAKASLGLTTTDVAEKGESLPAGAADMGAVAAGSSAAGLLSGRNAAMEAAISAAAVDPTAIVVEVNGVPVTLKGKTKYVYVDVFNFYHFDLTPRAGFTIETLLNGKQAEYMGPIKQGDQVTLKWIPMR